ncbi:hypothetical protein N0V90_010533 [Kalmusia sp. IMI 367209]|nr:hypothetical protein N0V90_010533 [Kalmusia sp. IMI 367209]
MECLPDKVPVSNSSFAPSTTSSIQTATVSSSSNVATITTAPLPKVAASANGTCPTSFPPDFPDDFATFTETCQSVQSRELYNKFYYLTDTCLISYCEAEWTSTWDSIGEASTTVWTTSVRTWFSGIPGTGSLTSVITGQQYWTSTYTFAVPPAQLVTLDPPCCGQCRFANPTIQLYFWPTASADPTPSVTGLPANATAIMTALPSDVKGTYVDDNGFTFTSPSLYLGFTSLGATDYCGPVGIEIYNTTIAFDPTEISTMLTQETRGTCTVTGTSRNGESYTTTAIDATIPAPLPITIEDVAQDCSTIEGYAWFANNPSNAVGDAAGDPCHPVIALPTKIQQLQPEWLDCMPIYGGFYDPPKTLKRGTVLVPTTASETPAPTSDPEPSSADPTSSEQPEPSSADPTSQEPQPSQPDPPSADPTSPQTPTPSDPQTPSPSNPQNPSVSNPQQPSVQPTTQPTGSIPSDPQNPTPSGPQTPSPSDPQEPIPSDPQEPSVQPQPSVSPSNAPQQPSNPGQGSSTTIVIMPPPLNPSSPSAPSGPSAPVVTLGPGPGANSPSPGNLSPDASTLNPTVVNPPNPSLPNAQPNPPVITLQPTIVPPGNTAISGPGSTVIIIGTQTLSPGGVITVGGSTSTLAGGQTTVLGGTQLVLDPQATIVIIDGTSTIDLPPAVTVQATPEATVGAESAAPVIITVGSTTLTADSLTQFTIGDQTLTGGGTVTESGTTYVLTTNTDGSTVLVAGTAGSSDAATLSATATESAENSTGASSRASSLASSTREESSTATDEAPSAPSNNGGAGSVDVRWRMLTALLSFGGWALMMA